MKTNFVMAVSLVVLSLVGGAANAGCGKGAAAGAVVGHVAGKHAVAGAAVGCAIGHHSAKKKQAVANAVTPANAAAPGK